MTRYAFQQQQKEEAFARFRSMVEAKGGVVLEPSYKGRQAKHHVRCAAGHDTYPLPCNVFKGGGFCRKCAGASASTAAWNAFRARVAELGGEVLEDAWKGSHVGHLVRCSYGHLCQPRPNSVQQGQGICAQCVPNRADASWDVFYVATGADVVKFGVSSGDPAHRLRAHARDGLVSVKVWNDLRGSLAYDLERLLLARLAADGVAPVRGQEYFPLSASGRIMRIVLAVLA